MGLHLSRIIVEIKTNQNMEQPCIKFVKEMFYGHVSWLRIKHLMFINICHTATDQTNACIHLCMQ